jgi:regulator of replication initiation timing
LKNLEDKIEILVTQNTRINESLTTLINENKKCSDEVKSLKEIIQTEVATSTKSADNEFIKVNILLYYIYIVKKFYLVIFI